MKTTHKKAIKLKLLSELPPQPTYQVIKKVAESYGISPMTAYDWAKKNGGVTQTRPKKPRTTTTTTTNPTTYTNPNYLKLGDEVRIQDCWDGDQSHVGKAGKLEQVHKSGRMRVLLNIGDDCIARKVIKTSSETIKPPRKTKIMSKAFKRWVLDYMTQNPDMTAAAVAKLFDTTAQSIYQWRLMMRKDARKYPMYTPRMSEEWNAIYFPSPKPEVIDEIDDQIAVEELTRSYIFTEGNAMVNTIINIKQQRISVTTIVNDNQEPQSLVGSIDDMEAYAKIMMGVVKMARTLKGG